MPPRDADDIFASILVDMARSAEIAPRMLPEAFGPGGRYLLEELIGIGRDSHVYRAVDRHLSKPTAPAHVAIKIRASAASTRTEALVGRSVVHDNVVRIIDHGELDDGTAYVVQEWVDGGDLTGLALPLPPRQAARLLAGVCRGVQALHAAGNIHGDIKPSNILRTREGAPKLTDFDLASAADLDEYATGGNLALMAPERILDHSVLPSPLSDIYALGGLLYLFVTGTPPHGDRPEAVIAHHRSGAPIPMPGLEPDLARICARALARNPAERYQSAEALAGDLTLWLDRRPIPWTRPSLLRVATLLARRRPLPLLAGVLAFALAGAMLAWVQVSISRDLESQRRGTRIAEQRVEQLNAFMRGAIRSIVASGVFGDGRNGSSVFVALAWLDSIARSPVAGEIGLVVTHEERVRVLLELRRHYRDTGQAGTLPDSLTAYCLAFVHVEAGEPDEAAPFLEEALAGPLGSLEARDDVRRSLDALRALIEFERAQRSADPAAVALREDLLTFRAEFSRVDGTHDIARLIDLAFKRYGLGAENP